MNVNDFVVCKCVYVRVNNKGSFKKSNFDKRGQLITSHYFLFAPTKATSFTTEVIRKYSCLLTLVVCQLELTSFYPKEAIIFFGCRTCWSLSVMNVFSVILLCVNTITTSHHIVTSDLNLCMYVHILRFASYETICVRRNLFSYFYLVASP